MTVDVNPEERQATLSGASFDFVCNLYSKPGLGFGGRKSPAEEEFQIKKISLQLVLPDQKNKIVGTTTVDLSQYASSLTSSGNGWED